MNTHRYFGSLGRLNHDRSDLGKRSHVFMEFRMRDDHRNIQPLCSINYRIDAFQIRRVERTDRDIVMISNCKDLFQINKHIRSPFHVFLCGFNDYNYYNGLF